MKTNDNDVSSIVDECLKFNIIKRDEFIFEVENGDKDFRKINRKELDQSLDKKLGELEISKEVQNIDRDQI